MVLTQIGVRTAHDKQQEAREIALMESISKENENPFQRAADAAIGVMADVYSDYLYTSGVLLVGWTCWGLYPRYARFRHARLFRFQRRRQSEFRRWFFATRHIPKWDKKYLQRIDMPSCTPSLAVQPNLQLQPQQQPWQLQQEPQGQVQLHVQEKQLQPQQHEKEETFAVITVRRTSGASFAGGARGKMENTIADGVAALNTSLQEQLTGGRRRPLGSAEAAALQQRVAALIHDGRGVVVLRETHQTRRALPEGREVWWVSQEEAQRRRDWWFWLKMLIAARILEDLLDMPDMPDFVQ